MQAALKTHIADQSIYDKLFPMDVFHYEFAESVQPTIWRK
jgi:hypothetical protein